MTKTELREALDRNAHRIIEQHRIIAQAQAHLVTLEAQRDALRAEVPVAKPRIDTLQPGATVQLLFHGRYGDFMTQTFVGISGTGDDRRATFHDDTTGDWDAYRYEGGWAYGTSAERLQLIAVEGVEL